MRDLARDLIAAQAELHTWRNGHQLGGMMEDMNAMQGRAVDAEAKLDAADAKIARMRQAAAEVRANGDASSESAADYIEAALAGTKDGE